MQHVIKDVTLDYNVVNDIKHILQGNVVSQKT